MKFHNPKVTSQIQLNPQDLKLMNVKEKVEGQNKNQQVGQIMVGKVPEVFKSMKPINPRVAQLVRTTVKD